MKRTLILKREALTELSASELDGLIGAAGVASGATCPALMCKLSLVHPQCPSAFTCPTE